MASFHPRGTLILLVVVAQLLSPYLTLPLKAETAVPAGNEASSGPAEAQKPKGAVGIASYYANRYNGRKTNSGQRYNPEKMTAAHPSLPHGTKVKVVNLSNDKEVVVTINDRCRKRKFPFIDLSRAAARELGFLGKGITKVRIIPLEEKS